MDAFDADVLVYAAIPGHPAGSRVLPLFPPESEAIAGIGSLVLLPEVLSKPMREGLTSELGKLVELLSRLDLKALDPVTAELAASLGAAYRLKAADAVHLATAVVAGADRFITNNRKDFPTSISEVAITHPEMLP